MWYFIYIDIFAKNLCSTLDKGTGIRFNIVLSIRVTNRLLTGKVDRRLKESANTSRDLLFCIQEKKGTMTLVPIGDNVVLRRLKSPKSTQGGIILPESAQKKLNEGKVLAVGDGKLLADGSRSVLQVKDGDRVLFQPYQATAVELNGDEYLIVPESGILAILE